MFGFEENIRRESELRRHRENQGRLATVNARCRTVGMGTIEYGEVVDFGLTFVEQPFVSSGCEIDLDAVRDALTLGDDEYPQLPQVTTYVTEWDQDDRNFYVGAYIGVVVEYPAGVDVTTEIEIFHHLSFTGVAIKDIPAVEE